MKLLLTGGAVFQQGKPVPANVVVDGGRIVSVSPELPEGDFSVVKAQGLLMVPGFVDVHVHLREPGFSYKETIASGTAAAAAGGYTAVCPMPNLNPVPDSPAHLQVQEDAIARSAVVRVYPYGAISVGQQGRELADLAALAPRVVAFSDDGHGVQSDALMEEAMTRCKALGRRIVAHCEDNALLPPGGCVHDGAFARAHDLPGIPSESEWRQIARDLRLVRKTGCPYHVCHVSAKESVALLRAAKAEGLPVTCETAPHYLTLCDADLSDEGRFKMNPPVRSAADRDALLAGLLDGTVDCIATDHAPHSAEEKSRGLRRSAMGIVGLETAFPVLYTRLVKPGIVPLETLLRALTENPRRIFSLPGGRIAPGEIADLTLLDLHRSHRIDPNAFLSMGRATPFAGWPVDGAVALTMVNGKIVYRDSVEREA